MRAWVGWGWGLGLAPQAWRPKTCMAEVPLHPMGPHPFGPADLLPSSRRPSPSIGKALTLGPPARAYPTPCGTVLYAPPGMGSTSRWGSMRVRRPAGSGEEVAANRVPFVNGR